MRSFLSGLAVVVLSLAMAASVAAAPGSSGTRAPLYYLSLGDSLAAGVQPTGSADSQFRTSDGYADQLYAIARQSHPNLRLVKLGCPGETTGTMIAGGICPYENGSQLADAVEFLHAHRKFVAFVTIDIGFNDFPCSELSCLAAGSASINQNLPTILAELREAAGPSVPIVGMTIYDPFLGLWLTGPDGQALARLSVSDAIVPINRLLTGLYAAAGSPVADVEGAFSTTDFDTPVSLPGFGSVPLNVARICEWTWVCASAPYGPNNHANAAGYQSIAQAFWAVLSP
jgi:lysophospholipase L1-like esterase